MTTPIHCAAEQKSVWLGPDQPRSKNAERSAHPTCFHMLAPWRWLSVLCTWTVWQSRWLKCFETQKATTRIGRRHLQKPPSYAWAGQGKIKLKTPNSLDSTRCDTYVIHDLFYIENKTTTETPWRLVVFFFRLTSQDLGAHRIRGQYPTTIPKLQWYNYIRLNPSISCPI